MPVSFPSPLNSSVRWKKFNINFFKLILISFIGFLLASMLLTKIAPVPEVPIVSEKLRQFEKNKNYYNVVFLGSSRIYRHIIPHIFDQQMTSQGYEIKSYNLGVSGMKFIETYFVLNQVLAMNPPNLKWVLIEIPDFDLEIQAENLLTDRVIYWHTLDHTLWIYQLI